MKKTIILTVCAWVAIVASAQITVDVDALERGPKISNTHYGIFFEDINHAADGGIYAELIRNRSFEDGEGYGKPATMEAWRTRVPEGQGMKGQEGLTAGRKGGTYSIASPSFTPPSTHRNTHSCSCRIT